MNKNHHCTLNPAHKPGKSPLFPFPPADPTTELVTLGGGGLGWTATSSSMDLPGRDPWKAVDGRVAPSDEETFTSHIDDTKPWWVVGLLH